MNLLVVGGGTATNAIASVFPRVADTVVYVVPISDNGGSTSEIIRVLGGPAIGDARSRLVRLMPPTPLRDLLGLRLPENEDEAAHAWNQLVEGVHPKWDPIPSHLKHMYRAFFLHVASEISKRRRPGTGLHFSHASVGNLLISGARIFFGSLDSAIEFVLRTARVSARLAVLPALSTNFSHHIAAELRDGSIVVGQTEISHPSDLPTMRPQVYEDEVMEDANIPFSHPSLSASQISFSKIDNKPLPSPVDRVFYVNPYGAEIKPRASRRVLSSLAAADALVLSVGSLYTSIIPVLLLQGFARLVMDKPVKVVLLNGTVDRETAGMDAFEHLEAIVRSCYYSLGTNGSFPEASWKPFLTHAFYIEPTAPDMMHVDVDRIQKRGVKCIAVRAVGKEYDQEALAQKLGEVLGTVGTGRPLRPVVKAEEDFPVTYPYSDY